MRDPELQAIIDSEVAAINAGNTATVLRNRVQAQNFNAQDMVRKAVDFYALLGGDKLKLRRGLQIVVDQWLAEQLAQTDLPGPDRLLVPHIREMVVLMIGKKFDELTA